MLKKIENTYLRYLYIVIVLVLQFHWNNGTAQVIDTNHLYLKEVIVIENKQKAIQTTKKTVIIDSTILKLNNTSTLAELLSNQTTMYIKLYGNGNISTSSIRGGNANHTAILWNGLSIQNPMLGQTDLSLIQSSLFNSVQLEYGGGSSAWGSGAIGGSIHLNNKAKFNEGVKTNLQINYASFENKKLNTAVTYSKEKLYSKTALYYNESKNNYAHIDTLQGDKQTKVVNHAEYIIKGIMQEIAFLVNSKNTFNARLWYNNSNRNIPSFTQIHSKKNQIDENLKMSGDWELKKQNFESTTKIAFFKDNLSFNDSVANIYSKSKVNTLIAETNNNLNFKQSKILFGANYTLYKTDTKNYDTLHKLNKIALFGGYSINLLKNKLSYTIFIRQEFTNQTIIPLTGNTGILYAISKSLHAKINASKSYRQPSLNDLYWKEGGNRNLLPESSKEMDGSIVFSHDFKSLKLSFEGSYFNRLTNNWIIWLPSDKGYWTPRNILEVYSRGTETKTSFTYIKNKLMLKLDINTSYVLSTNTKNMSENDNSKGRQLIYSPRYTGNSAFLLNYKNLNFLYSINYTGYRFTTTDNTSWLSPYYISNIRLSNSFNKENLKITLFCAIQNLFNKNYIVVQNNPMPLRNYEIGLSIQFYKKNKIKFV